MIIIIMTMIKFNTITITLTILISIFSLNLVFSLNYLLDSPTPYLHKNVNIVWTTAQVLTLIF